MSDTPLIGPQRAPVFPEGMTETELQMVEALREGVRAETDVVYRAQCWVRRDVLLYLEEYDIDQGATLAKQWELTPEVIAAVGTLRAWFRQEVAAVLQRWQEGEEARVSKAKPTPPALSIDGVTLTPDKTGYIVGAMLVMLEAKRDGKTQEEADALAAAFLSDPNSKPLTADQFSFERAENGELTVRIDGREQ